MTAIATPQRTATMTGRQRVNRMLERQDHDRVPRFDSYWGETIARWASEGMVGGYEAALELLEIDFQGIGWIWPAPFPGNNELVSEDELTRVTRDSHGKTVRYWKHKSGTPEHIAFGCDSREIWEKQYKPALLKNWMQVDLNSAKQAAAKAHATGRWPFFSGVESFEQTRALMGDEATLMAMAEDPEWVADVSRTYCDVMIQNWQHLWDAGLRIDGVWCYGDMAFRSATMCSPAMYKELIWPDHKRLADWAHQHNAKFIYHTDGDVTGVIDLYLQAGFDCIQPMESKAGMDVRKLSPKYGTRLSFFGNIDVMVMATNDREKIEEEIRTKFAAGMANKGYAYHSDHSVPPLTSWETYQFIIDRVKHYGWYE